MKTCIQHQLLLSTSEKEENTSQQQQQELSDAEKIEPTFEIFNDHLEIFTPSNQIQQCKNQLTSRITLGKNLPNL